MEDFEILSESQQLQLQDANTKDDIEQILNIFNLNLKKKELLRLSKLSDLQDTITDQVQKRLDRYSDEFSNKDLIDYYWNFPILQYLFLNISKPYAGMILKKMFFQITKLNYQMKVKNIFLIILKKIKMKKH